MNKGRYLVIVAVAAGVLACRAATYYVTTTGSDANDGSTWDLAVATISNGVAKALVADDLVLVSNGTYQLTTNIYVTNGIILRGFNGRNVTIVDGGGAAVHNRCLFLNHTSALVESFTFMNGNMPTSSYANGGVGGGVYLNGGTLQNCIIVSNIAVNGGGVYNQYGTVSNCEICYNLSITELDYAGGGLYGRTNTALTYNCSIFGNSTTSAVGPNAKYYGMGGGAMLREGALLADSRVSNNYAFCNAGGVGVFYGGIISNCLIADNRTTSTVYSFQLGGGIYSYKSRTNSPLTIFNSVISNNYAAFQGGGIAVDACTSSVYGCYVGYNFGRYYGGGISLGNNYACSTLLTNCVVSNNTLGAGAGYGGGIFMFPGSSLTATWCRVVGNTASNSIAGAGVYANSNCFCFLDHCIISGNRFTNSSATAGGGLYFKSAANANVLNCLISDNVSTGSSVAAGGAGGGIYIESNATCTVSSCSIAGNFAKNNGGGVYLNLDGGDTFTNCVIASNSLSAAAADNDLYLPTSARSNAFYWSCGNVLTNTAQGNITNAPVFAGPASGNWRMANNSPCVDSGNNEAWMWTAVDLDWNHRINGFNGRVDMGCYETVPNGSRYNFR